MKKNAPFWAVLPSISFEGDSIRRDFAAMLDGPLMEKVGRRTDRMVWVEGTNLHMESLATLMDIHPDSIVTAWRVGLERAKTGHTTDDADRCLFGSIASLYDSVFIHTGIWDQGKLRLVRDSVVPFDMERRARLKNPLR
jgi:hypothetical protein